MGEAVATAAPTPTALSSERRVTALARSPSSQQSRFRVLVVSVISSLT
jgi:hypothetical protein